MKVIAPSRHTGLLGPAAVILFFCVPLFVGLGGTDLANDESIYSYSVIRMLETGEWLTPRAIPSDGPFLEKPPLKLWMVAAPIALGWLPRDEFGLRAVDALLGGLAFLYVFLLGRWQSGAVGGIAAVLVLYTFDPLLFDHGLRSNNMEAALVLCYAGGVYHFARWLDGGANGSAARHRWAVTLYFTIGFLSKFVAIFFLPLICAAAAFLRAGRSSPARWREWIAPAGLFVLLSAPWFVYQTLVSGRLFWHVLFWQHVYARFTGGLDVQHLQPWDYYFWTLWLQLQAAHTHWISLAGAVVLGVSALRRDGWLARVFLFWGLVPVALLSLSSSKLFHYIYPFLPPVALAAGAAASLVFGTIAGAFSTLAAPWIRRVIPRTTGSSRRAVRWSGRMLILLAGVSVLVGLMTAVTGSIDWQVAGWLTFRNASLTRPFLMAAAFLCVAGELKWTARLLATSVLMVILPVNLYPDTLERASLIDRPLHAVRECVRDVRRSGTAVGHTLYDAALSRTTHPYDFYLRGFEPWTRTDSPDPGELRRQLLEPGRQGPIIITDAGYVEATLAVLDASEPASRSPGLVGFRADNDLIVLLPGPYARCAPEAALAGGAPVGFVVNRGLAR